MAAACSPGLVTEGVAFHPAHCSPPSAAVVGASAGDPLATSQPKIPGEQEAVLALDTWKQLYVEQFMKFTGEASTLCK